MIAASRRLGVHSTVLIEEADEVTPIQMRRNNSTADTLVLHLKNSHYQVIVPDPHRPEEEDTNSPKHLAHQKDRRSIWISQVLANAVPAVAAEHLYNWMPKHTPESTPLRTPAWLPEHLKLLQPRNHKPKRPQQP